MKGCVAAAEPAGVGLPGLAVGAAAGGLDRESFTRFQIPMMTVQNTVIHRNSQLFEGIRHVRGAFVTRALAKAGRGIGASRYMV